MTNIEFLVNELRKAHETIANLRQSNIDLKRTNNILKARLASYQNDVSLGDLDALAILKRKMEENI